MTPLEACIAALIERGGPISLERFWNIALFDRDHGYYTSGSPIGEAGDFTTAPEISQMFGELLAAWLVSAWRELGRPAPFVLAEFGPGRGTLMADIVRTALKLDPAFMKAARIALIEVSDRLAAEQLAALGRFDLPVQRVRRFGEIEELPILLVANELLDAVAIRQACFRNGAWRERMVDHDPARGLHFVDGASLTADAPRLPTGADPQEGTLFEWSPLREALAAEIGQAVARRGGAALLLDYGHADTALGDTLQALRAHRFADPLRDPGRHDITSHVDFERVGTALASGGAVVSPAIEQGSFLLSLGLVERAGALGAAADEQEREALRAAVQRLAGTGAGDMGQLFKVVAAASRALALPPFPSTIAVD